MSGRGRCCRSEARRDLDSEVLEPACEALKAMSVKTKGLSKSLTGAIAGILVTAWAWVFILSLGMNEIPELDGAARCATHQDEVAAAVCERCGDFYCLWCQSSEQGLCLRCERLISPALKTAMAWTLGGAFGVLVAMVLGQWTFMPILNVFLFLYIGPFVLVFWSLMFLLWSHCLWSGRQETPKLSYGLMGFVVLTQFWYVLIGYSYFFRWQSIAYFFVVLGFFCVWLVVMLFVTQRQRHAPSFFGNLAFHWLLFSYIAGAYLPWFGEFL